MRIPNITVFLLFFMLCSKLCLSQDDFFSAGSKKEKIEVLNKWAAEAMQFIESDDFKSSGEYLVIQKLRINSHYMAFSNELFKKYFRKPYAELTQDEMVEVTDVLYMRGRGISHLQVEYLLREPFLTEKGFKKSNPSYVRFVPDERGRTAIMELNRENISRPLRGMPTVTGKRTITNECLGLKMIEAGFENRARGLLVTGVLSAGSGFLAGIQPGDLLLYVIKPGITDADRFFGVRDELGFLEFLGSPYYDCSGSKYISFGMIYKNPDSAGYLPFTGKLVPAMPKPGGQWMSDVQGTVEMGYPAMITTKHNRYGEFLAKENQVPAISHGAYTWPKRNQFKGLDATISMVNNTYSEQLQKLKAKVQQLPCLFDDESVEFEAYKDAAVKLDQLYASGTGKADGNTLQEIYSILAERCRPEWWNIPGNSMTAVVRNILTEDKAAWGNHLVKDNWGRWVRALFIASQQSYKATCFEGYPEPMDTLIIRIKAVSDLVKTDKSGRELMRSTGQKGSTDYYSIRKKYSKHYVALFNELHSGGVITLTTSDVAAQKAAESYLYGLYQKINCSSDEMKLFEQKLFNAVLFLNPLK